MPNFRVLFALAACALAAHAQTPSQPDILILNDGEKLIGTLERSTGSAVKFKSDALGEVTVDWSKVKELHSSRPFAVVPKHAHLGRHPDTTGVAKGAVAVEDGKVAVSGRSMPVAESAEIVDQPSFDKAVEHRPGFLEDWKGAITAGASLVFATQNNRTFSGATSLVRTVPEEDWLERLNRTTVDFNAAYGKLTQPGQPDIRTEIYHFDGERDEYFSPRLYGFAEAAYDHNYSQGLDLQQNYGGGAGWTVIKTAATDVDLKLGASYIAQQFTSVSSQNLIASTGGENLTRKFRKGILFTQQLSLIGTLNNLSAYSGSASATLALPLYKRLNVSFSAIDGFLADPPPGFRKNSFQFTTGVTYLVK